MLRGHYVSWLNFEISTWNKNGILEVGASAPSVLWTFTHCMTHFNIALNCQIKWNYLNFNFCEWNNHNWWRAILYL